MLCIQSHVGRYRDVEISFARFANAELITIIRVLLSWYTCIIDFAKKLFNFSGTENIAWLPNNRVHWVVLFRWQGTNDAIDTLRPERVGQLGLHARPSQCPHQFGTRAGCGVCLWMPTQILFLQLHAPSDRRWRPGRNQHKTYTLRLSLVRTRRYLVDPQPQCGPSGCITCAFSMCLALCLLSDRDPKKRGSCARCRRKVIGRRSKFGHAVDAVHLRFGACDFLLWVNFTFGWLKRTFNLFSASSIWIEYTMSRTNADMRDYKRVNGVGSRQRFDLVADSTSGHYDVRADTSHYSFRTMMMMMMMKEWWEMCLAPH